ncbi:protein disulfide oxidoreductase [Thermogemmatispora sp.]|uniref:protein disulfide oxidoreductase n=1 Tax=Thermogemmatispora sp. TaxID=1968838 RepID=UPI001DCA85F7|nr:thioredoxin family protein [Thermogemmatispora sp.]MBX5448956.1 thioredoxin family protein [Thermogemmatispora sp.]
MALIGASDREKIRELFKDLDGEVTITYFTQRESPLLIPGHECQFCKETRELLEEVASLSDKIHLQIKDFYRDEVQAKQLQIERIPAFILEGKARGRLRFFGIPAGYEFSTLIEDIRALSRGDLSLSPQTLQQLQTLQQNLHIQVFVTPTCPYCPRMALLAHQLAMASERVTADVVEISEFVDLAQRYRVQGVPKTVINDRLEVLGAVPEARLMQQIAQAFAPQATQTSQASQSQP